MIKTGIFNGYEKLPQPNGNTNIELFMAKNEGESCVITLVSESEIKNASFIIKGDSEGFKIQIEKEYFIDCKGKIFPDPLVPVERFDIEKGEKTNILIRFTSNAYTAHGNHPFVFALVDQNNNVLSEYNVNVRVWNFMLPNEHTVNTSMDLYREQIARFHGVEGAALEELYRKYYDLLLDFRVNAFYLPYDILDERADKYLSDPRVTSVWMGVERKFDDDEVLKKQYEKLKTNPDWLRKAMIYPLDEPTCKEHLDALSIACERVKQICPGVRRTSAFFKNIAYDENNDEVSVLLENCDLMLPKLTCFNDEFIYEIPEHKEKYGTFQSRMDKAKAQGKEIWQYVCWEPGKPYVNMYVDESGLDHRILFWQQHLVGATGFLYWATNYWRLTEDPWDDMATVPDLSEYVFGDGSLLYHGKRVNIDGGCASVRLEAVRDGIEDCEMLLLADKVLGREWVLEKVKVVTKNLKEYTDSSTVFNSVRVEIASALEKALNK